MNRHYLHIALKNNCYFLIAATIYAFIQLGLVIHFGATTKEILIALSSAFASQVSLLCALAVGNVVLSTPILLEKEPYLKRLSHFLSVTETKTLTYFKTPRSADAIILLICILPFFFSFIVGKSLIPFIHPFAFDKELAALDFAIHFGHYPHTLLPSLKNSYWVTNIAEYAYVVWFLILPIANGYAIFFDDNAKRRKIYFWTSFVMWAGFGSVLATIFSSVGPIFYGDFVTGPNPYTDIHADMLKAEALGSDLWPSTVHLLTELNQHAIPCDLNGISAFPSMHVGESALTAIYAWSLSRKLGIVMAIYTAVILASSIILGFHYAVDGYFSILGVSALWWVLNRLVKPPKHSIEQV